MALAVGKTTITVTYPNGVLLRATVTVNSAMLTGIAVSPTAAVFKVGETAPLTFVAGGVYSDGTKFPLPASSVVWASSDLSIATVTASGIVTGLSKGVATITATDPVRKLSNAAQLTVTLGDVSAVSVTGPKSVPVGLDETFTATVVYKDNLHSAGCTGVGPSGKPQCPPPTGDILWSTSDPTIASVSASGVVTGLSTGATTLIATYTPTGRTGALAITVNSRTLYKIDVTASSSTIPVDGSVTLQAKLAGIAGTLRKGPDPRSLPQVTWSSSNEAVATVDDTGEVTGVKAGRATISATDPISGVTGTLVLTVRDLPVSSVEVTPTRTTLPSGGVTQSFIATAIYTRVKGPSQSNALRVDVTALAAWNSSDLTIALVSNTSGSEGVVTTQNAGVASITATFSGVTGIAKVTVQKAVLKSIAVSPQTASVPLGTTQPLTATGTFVIGVGPAGRTSTHDVTALVTWTSSNKNLTVSNAPGSEGLVDPNKVGSSIVTATDATGKVSGNAWLTVTAAKLTALTIAPGICNLPLGLSQQFRATGTFSDSTHKDLTDTILWTSSAGKVATISNVAGSYGRAMSLAAGSTQIGAFDPTSGLRAADATLNVGGQVLTALTIAPGSATIANGLSVPFKATGTYNVGAAADLTSSVVWSVIAGTATVSNAAGSYGVATSNGAGTSNIQAVDPTTGLIATATLNVTPAPLVSIAVTPARPNVPVGTTQQLVATGTFADATTADLTASVAWSSDNGDATVSNVAGQSGLATGVMVGPTTITAMDPTSGISGTTLLTVTSAGLVAIAVTPAASTLADGTTEQLIATATYSDGSIRDVTSSVTWGSSAPMIFSVSSSSKSMGLGSALAYGSAVVSAIDPNNGITGTTTVTVTPLNRCEPLSFAATSYVTGSAPVGLVSADLNGDGLTDLVSGDYLSGVHVFLGKSDGTFSDRGESAMGNYLLSVSVGDVNGDGKPDIVAPNYTLGTVSVGLGNGDGTFQAPIVTAVPEDNVVMAQLGDANGDGVLDLAVGINVPGHLYIMLGKGDGTFTLAGAVYDLQGTPFEGPLASKFADVNGDGKQDLLVANAGTVAAVLIGNGDGSFAPPVRYETGNYPMSIEVQDVNGDGKLDIVVACYVTEQISVLLGKGDGTFAPHLDSLVGIWPTYNIDALTLADFDGDGILDVATAGSYSNSVSILTGNGDGTFSSGPSIPTGAEPKGIVSGDFNQDGKPDLAVNAEADNQLSVLMNSCSP